MLDLKRGKIGIWNKFAVHARQRDEVTENVYVAFGR